MSDPCKIRFRTWIDQKTGGAILSWVVVDEEHNSALAREVELREELERQQCQVRSWKSGHEVLKQRLTSAERRNAEFLIQLKARDDLLDELGCLFDTVSDLYLNPTESGASDA